MADVSVRAARPEDAELIARVQLSTWNTAYAELLPREALELPLVQAAAMWLNAIEAPPSPRHRVLVALDGGELVGFASSTPSDDQDLDPATTAELATILVEPRWGRRGHGSRLLAATVDHWHEDGVEVGVQWVLALDPVTAGFLASAGWAQEPLTRSLEARSHSVRQNRWHTSLV